MDGLVLFCSCYSSLRSRGWASRIPPRTGTWAHVGLKLAHVGSFFALFARLGRFLNVFGSSWPFLYVWKRVFFNFWLIFHWFRQEFGTIFDGLLVYFANMVIEWKPLKNQWFSIVFKDSDFQISAKNWWNIHANSDWENASQKIGRKLYLRGSWAPFVKSLGRSGTSFARFRKHLGVLGNLQNRTFLKHWSIMGSKRPFGPL